MDNKIIVLILLILGFWLFFVRRGTKLSLSQIAGSNNSSGTGSGGGFSDGSNGAGGSGTGGAF